MMRHREGYTFQALSCGTQAPDAPQSCDYGTKAGGGTSPKARIKLRCVTNLSLRDPSPRKHSGVRDEMRLAFCDSHGPQLQTLALNKKQKRRRVSHSAPLVRTNLTQFYFRPKRARRPAKPVKPKPKRAAAVPLSGVLVSPPLQILQPERQYM